MTSNNKVENLMIFSCWVIATVATLASLFFSEIMGFIPCALCWYQRIAMYPLVILLGLGIFQPAKYTILYSFPLISIGWLIALYHNLLHYGIIPESASPCRSGVPCSTIYVNWFGFITIPMLSFMSFTIILIIFIFLHRRINHEK